MANMLTHLSRGDTALSVSMTAISSVGAIVTVPLFLALAAGHFGADDVGEASMLGVVARVFAITIVPVALGMELRRRHPRRIEEPSARPAGSSSAGRGPRGCVTKSPGETGWLARIAVTSTPIAATRRPPGAAAKGER